MEVAGIPSEHRYKHNWGEAALRDFLDWLDTSDNNVISEAEVEGIVVKVCGYSWGAVSAIGFTQKLSQTGTIVLGGSPGNPISYRLDVTVPIEVVFVIDPVDELNQPGTVPSTVQNFINYYQHRGGGAIFRNPDGTIYTDDYGSTGGKLLWGEEVVSASASSLQRQVEVVYPAFSTTGKPFLPNNPLELVLRSNEVNHEVMPWLVTAETIEAME